MDNPTYMVNHVDYNSLTPPKGVSTRVTVNSDCMCSVCITGRLSGKDYVGFKTQASVPVGRQPTETTPLNTETGPVVVCNVCLCEYGKGLPHKCNKSTLQENTTNLGKINTV